MEVFISLTSVSHFIFGWAEQVVRVSYCKSLLVPFRAGIICIIGASPQAPILATLDHLVLS